MTVPLTGNYVFFRSNDADSSTLVYEHPGELTNFDAVRGTSGADNYAVFRSSGADNSTFALQRRGECTMIGGIQRISLIGNHTPSPTG
jgi:hypothetical protein